MGTKLDMHLGVVVEDFMSKSRPNIMSKRVHILTYKMVLLWTL